jgi:hypothetical protein
MSDDGIQLSPQLVSDLRDAMVRQDPRTQDDVLAMQYLVATAGLLLSEYENPQMDKNNALDDLAGFMKHVFDYMEQQKAQRPPPQEAFGVWKP